MNRFNTLSYREFQRVNGHKYKVRQRVILILGVLLVIAVVNEKAVGNFYNHFHPHFYWGDGLG